MIGEMPEEWKTVLSYVYTRKMKSVKTIGEISHLKQNIKLLNEKLKAQEAKHFWNSRMDFESKYCIDPLFSKKLLMVKKKGV